RFSFLREMLRNSIGALRLEPVDLREFGVGPDAPALAVLRVPPTMNAVLVAHLMQVGVLHSPSLNVVAELAPLMSVDSVAGTTGQPQRLRDAVADVKSRKQ